MSEFLSQEEVDALLKGVTGEVDDAPAAELGDGPRPYDLATQERIVRGRMPTLEIINERFARLMRLGLFNLMRRNPEVSVGPVKVQKYNEFIRNLVVPTNINIMQLKPLRGSCLMVFDPSVVFAVVDNMFGGDGRFHTRVEGRDFTQTEQRIIQRMLTAVADDYMKAWAPVYPLHLEYTRSEMHTQFANIATPSEIVITTSFQIEFGSAGGSLHICFPYAVVEPIRDVLYSSTQGDSYEPDTRWLRMLSRQVQIAEVELVADFAHMPATVRSLLSMKPGDVIPLEMPQSVVAQVDGVPIFDCKFGSLNGRHAIRIEKILAVSAKENNLGEDNG
ncbi:MAG TPA: flagellar motor switch protein FliM [Burkholderiales bacterium]|jgi:flagellar motor switch protein FliM